MKKKFTLILAVVMALALILGSASAVSAAGKPGTVHITGVTLDNESANVRVSDTLTLNATLAPPDATNTKVTWSTSNRKVATVSGSGLTAEITGVKAGTATITVKTADGKFSDTCEVTVTTLPPDSVTFYVTNESGNPFQGIQIDLSGTEGRITTTDVNGYGIIDNMKNGPYQYHAWYPDAPDDYEQVYGDFTFSGVSQIIPLTIRTLYTVTFTVSDADTSDPIEEVYIEISDSNHDYYDQASTGPDGKAYINLLNGSYYYEASAAGYQGVSAVSFDVLGSAMSIDFSMAPIPKYTVTFTVTDAVSGTPISDVLIEVYSYGWFIAEAYTDSNGQAIIDLPDDNYNYQANAIGYNSVSAVPFVVSGFDMSINFSMTLSPKHTVTFNVKDANSSDPIDGVWIDVYDSDWNYIGWVLTDSSGQGTIDLPDGSYYYAVSASGYEDISSASFDVSGTEMTVAFEMVPYSSSHTVTFAVTDSDTSDSIESVEISIYDYSDDYVDTVYTGVNGAATIDLPDGSYYFDATCDGYQQVWDGEFTVSGEETSVSFDMNPSTYTITFTALDGNNSDAPLEGVTIEIYDDSDTLIDTVLTGSNGEATVELKAGSYKLDAYGNIDGHNYHLSDYTKISFEVPYNTYVDFELWWS
jgi:uncharacterized protein YjdB